MSAVEALLIQPENIDFSSQSTKIYVKAQYSKNILPREIYISDEATDYLKTWLDSKYCCTNIRNPKDFVFVLYGSGNAEGMYCNIATEFRAVLKTLDF